MVSPQMFFSDQKLTILSEIEPSEASGKVAKSLVFNGNWIDIIINYSTTKTLIKILTIQILGTIPGYRMHPLWSLDKIRALRTTRLSARLRWLEAYIAKYGIGLVLWFICARAPSSHQSIHQEHHDDDFGRFLWIFYGPTVCRRHLYISEHTKLVNLKSASFLGGKASRPIPKGRP
jgi:hypothetical protein